MRQRGVALITALLVVALATIAAVAMATRQQLDIRRTTNMLEYDQALLYTMGMEDWAGQVLRRDQQKNQVDSLDEEWATVLPPIPVDGGQLSGALEDMQARFNINNLLDATGKIDNAALDRFRRLLTILQLPLEIADALADWLDADDDVRMGGAEQIEYLSLTTPFLPYRAFNGEMKSPSELRLVKGVTPEIYATLLPFVATLPRGTPFNVNTVPENKPQLIMALAPDISEADATQVLQNRGKAGFASVQEFAQQPAFAGRALQQTGLTVNSFFFMLTSHVQVGRSTYTTFSLIKRDTSGAPHTLMRAQGIY